MSMWPDQWMEIYSKLVQAANRPYFTQRDTPSGSWGQFLKSNIMTRNPIKNRIRLVVGSRCQKYGNEIAFNLAEIVPEGQAGVKSKNSKSAFTELLFPIPCKSDLMCRSDGKGTVPPLDEFKVELPRLSPFTYVFKARPLWLIFRVHPLLRSLLLRW